MAIKLLLGTRNPAKIAILRAALAPLPLQVVTPDDLGIDLGVVEDGQSTVENAEKKAVAYRAVSGLPTLAIDGGLHIAGLPENRQPGIYVRRIPAQVGHEDAGDQAIVDHYAWELAAIGGHSTGTWTGGVALALLDGRVIRDSFTFDVLLAAHQVGPAMPGAPLDALSLDPATGRPYGELPLEDRPDCLWIRSFVTQHLTEL